MEIEIEIEKTDEFCGEDPRELASKWQVEIKTSQKELEKWHKQGDKIVKRFLDNRTVRDKSSKLNLFTSNIQTLRAMLYGSAPKVDVRRRFADANDEPARVAAEMLERLLNTEIEDNGESYDEALFNGLNDRLLAGLGIARVRYEADFEQEEIEAQIGMNGEILAEAYVEDRKVSEDAVVDYVYWKDFLWSPARTWAEVRWVAFKAEMRKEDVEERFGEYYAHNLQYKSRKKFDDQGSADDPTQRADIWEIWCKDTNMVYWWSEGCERILDAKEDPLELDNFFPCPKPMFANLTTSSLEPTPDFVLAQDQYNEIDALTTRINMLQKAVKAVGVYDKSSEGVQRMMNEAYENQLIPVDNWALFAEKGGIAGQVAWMPLSDIVNAMDKLREYRKEVIELMYQVTGMSDVMRGAQTMGSTGTATEYLLKSRFGSIRVQEIQARFTDFAADLQRIKSEIICKHFDDQTIVQRSNMAMTTDANLIQPALQLLRDRTNEYRVEIESETMAMTDYAQLQSERSQYLDGLAKFLSTAAPMVTQVPQSLPFLLEMLKWGMAGFKGSSEIEQVMDQAIQKAQQAADQPQGQQPSPEQMKAQMEMQKQQMKSQAKMAEIQAKTQADMQKTQASTQADIMKTQANLEADKQREMNQAYYNIQEEQAKAELKLKDDYIRRMAGG